MSLVPGVVSVSFTREMGPLFTGIVLASRIGAAYTAELGAMMAERTISHLGVLRRLVQLSKAFFIAGNRRETRLLVAAMLGLCILVGVVQVFVSYAGRNFVTSLVQRDAAAFYRNLWIYLATFAVAIPVGVIYRYTGERLSLLWREWMTHLLVKRYFLNRAYYRLRSSNRVDNPDQRISEDVKSFTTGVLGYLLTLINSGVTLVAFLGVLWTISWTLPVALLLYATAGTGLSILIGRRLVGMHFLQYQKEADFRYALVRVRDNAESIAFFRGEKREHRDLLSRFAHVVTNTMSIIGWNRTLGFFTNSLIFLSQRPYMVQGNLRSQLVYPQSEEGADDEVIREALKKVHFTEVLDRVDGDFDRSVDWTNILSLGEQQRVSFARIFLRKPVLAFLDEATSSLDEENEQILYQNLRELGISFVSVGHRSTLKKFHDHLILLNKDGTVEMSELGSGANPDTPGPKGQNPIARSAGPGIVGNENAG